MTATQSGAGYTCPMHPQVRQDQAGRCSLCGMALESVRPVAHQTADPELRGLQWRVWSAAALTLPVVWLGMGAELPLLGARLWVAPRLSVWIQAALTTLVVAGMGAPLLQRGVQSVWRRAPNMFTLTTLGTGTAYLYSLAALLVPAWFPAPVRHQGTVPVYFEAAAVITVLVLLGQLLELRARAATGSALRALFDLAPRFAHRLRDNAPDEQIALEQVQVGDCLRVRPGETVPVDGSVLQGRTAIDESMLTGESLPVAKAPGTRVIAGTINGTGSITMRAERVGADTVLAGIVRMVAAAQRSRAPIQHLADTVAGWFVPIVLLIALGTFVAWLALASGTHLNEALLAAVSVLLIACPCALGLATPMSIMVGMGRGARAGILIRDAEALERMAQVDTLVVDKTGTLTEGKPRVISLTTLGAFEKATVLAHAASLERLSEHPLAGAIVAAAAERHLALEAVSEFRSLTGLGVTGLIQGKAVAVGNSRLLHSLNLETNELALQAEGLQRLGASTVWVVLDGAVAGLIAINDPIRPSTAAALETLRRKGLRIVLASGDARAAVNAVAQSLHLSEVQAELLPQAKSALIRALRSAGHVVAIAGDGINDAPALAEADVGLALSTGTDIAMQTAGFTLMHGDLAGIVRARALSLATVRNIKQNLLLAFGYNVLAIPLAAGVLYPATGLLPNPMLAAAAMSLSSVSVIANALRLRRLRL